ncbi:uncharacterized protein LOC126906777 [Daktulosphaira vitifoliae]|uniref:uncharacterized protein LOC126906777 n=1 Tax=Daktulosphaira vitifoliae TaxID=58002 RepID=UPI0021AAAE84|nr:uncharacterized protein LOC126906777 [Daktulosphaira vitifoliae]
MEPSRKTSHILSKYLSESDSVQSNKNIIRVLWLSLVVTMPCLAPGMSFGYAAIALDQLPLTVSEGSWFASLPSIFMPIGCLLSGPLIDRLGRKTALMVINFPSILGWLCLAQQPVDLTVFYIGQLFVGLSVGMSSTPATVYAAECITVNYTGLRGCFTIMTSIMLNFGMFLTYFLGMLIPVNSIAYTAAFVSLASLLGICCLIPESPPWLFGQGRRGDAELSQKVLRITQPILQAPKVELLEEKPVQRSEFFVRVRDPDVYKPIIIMTTFLFLQQTSGSFVVTTYVIQILQDLKVTVNSYLITLIVGFTNLSAMSILSLLLTKNGFKQLSLVSCSGVSLCMISLGLFLYFDVRDGVITNIVVIALILLYTALNGLGLRPIPFAMLGEVFPSDVAGVAGSFATCSSSIFNFIAIKMYPYFFIWLGPGVFIMYGLISSLAIIFVINFLPDTKGKTIQQIGDDFTRDDDASTTTDII